MPKETAQKSKLLPVEVSVSTPKDKKAPEVRVYLFDAAGRLAQSVPAKAHVELQIDPQQRYRVTVGPDLLHKRETPPADLSQRLVNAGAISRDYLPQQPVSKISVSVEENLSALWLFVCMNIHGRVQKRLNPDSSAYAPICTGVVQIFTIDLACSLANLSDADLLNIRNQTLARMVGVEISDLLSLNWSDFARISTLAAGLFPLTGNALRSYIVANRAALASFMCELIPEWAICYQQLPDAPIQSDGTFSLEYCFLSWEAPPDLYFEVVQTIDGVVREVADPDILCTTMWAYDGSQSAVITVDDPAAIACQPMPLPGPGYLYVWPTAIGNTDLRQIDGLETLLGTGLLPGGPVGTPWGGTLCLQMQFDPNLRANNIHYYRWSYKFDGDADFTQVNASVTHRWQEITFGPGGVINIHLHPETLGPQLKNGQSNLFEIPDPSLPWIDINDPADRPFAYFDSTGGQTPGRTGMVTLKLEMFDHDGNHVVCGNTSHGGPFQFLLPDLGGVPDSYTNAPAPNIDASGNLVVRIRVDNNPTTAQFPLMPQPVHIGGRYADDCGMLHYASGGEVVTIDYVATHPNNFLWWDLSVSRGSHGVVKSLSGDVSSANPDHFNNSASSLLDSCVQAAFAVNLNTHARATNGYGRQSQYDRSATIAFALLTP
ncbi:MAG: hypothetical protein ACYDH9_07235 [Limisphaerales bacterium]